MKIIRGVGIFITVLLLVLIVLFNVNNVVYKTNKQYINFFGYKLMTIDNKYDYYLVKNVKVDDVILYDNISFRVNSTDLSTDKVKGKMNDCLKLANSSTVVCNDDLEGKVVMKVSGARDFLLVNKGSLIVLVLCIILLILVFLWKPKYKKEKVIEKPKEKKEDSVIEINTEPFQREEHPVEETPENNNDQTVIIDTSPFKEEVKEDIEVPINTEDINREVSEVESFNVNTNLPEQNNIEVPKNDFVNKFEMAMDTPPVENYEVEDNYVPEDVIVVPHAVPVEVETNQFTAPTNEELEDVIVVPLRKEEDESLNDIIVVPYDKVMEKKQEEEPVEKDYSEYSDVITVPLTYSSDRYDEYAEVIKVPLFRDEKDDFFDTNVSNDIFSDANINRSVEIDLSDIKVDSTSEKVQVTPIYSSDVDLNEDVEVL